MSVVTEVQAAQQIIRQLVNYESSAQHSIAASRQKLAEAAAGTVHAETLGSYVRDIANEQGAVAVYREAREIFEFVTTREDNPLTVEKAAQTVYLALTRRLRADDTWSGRGNDVRRSEFDGKLSALDNIRPALGLGF